MSKPTIVCADDEPEVLSAVDRDLRRHFKSSYRIVKAGSGMEALDATRALKERGGVIALFLVDERMPGMTGTEFLKEAKKLFPDAKKVLLTAYADTEAAICAINDIGLNHYSLKPWDPPEEKLYPVLDDVLSDWAAHARPAYDGIRLCGAQWSASCFDARDFLSRNHVPYQWIDIEADPSMRELVSSLTGSSARLPVVFFPDGTHLVTPSLLELAERVGLQTRAARTYYDVAIIGGGPAGLAAAVYGASEGLHTVLIEKDAPGGQAGTSSSIENYLGFPTGLTGAELARRAAAQAKRFGAEIVSPREIVGVRREDPYRIITMGDGSEISCKALIIATGVSVRELPVDGAERLAGRGVYYGAAMTEAASYRDKHVAIIGGANSAGQGALFFSRYAKRVTMLVRADALERSMSQYLVDRIRAAHNITVLTHTQVRAIEGESGVERLRLEHKSDGSTSDLAASGVFVFIGALPRTDIVADLVRRDDRGFILTDRDLIVDGKRPVGWVLERDIFPFETSVPGIFAAGDVRHGSGKRVAAAVGEGSATVSMVHKYLATV